MKFLVVISVLLSVVTAHAEIVFSPAASYFKTEDEVDGTSVSEMTLSTYDLRLGYVHHSGLYLGGMYQMSKRSYGPGSSDKGYAAGPTLGYNHYSGFYALFTYFLVAEHDYPAPNKITDGMGPQVDVGWVFPLTHMFFIGPQISYRSIGYDKIETPAGSTNTEVTRSDILPYISLWFRF